MSSEFNVETELVRVDAEIESTKEKLATLTKVKLGLIPDQRLTKSMSSMTEKNLCERALKIIADNAHDPDFNLPRLSAAVGVGTVLTSFILNRTYQRSFPKLLTDARIEIARKLLGQPGVSIKSAAMQSGFTDNHYFSRVFTKYVGVTPTNYVRMKQQANAAAKIRNQPDPVE